MDPIEILGSLLGQKAGGSGKGADILKQILTGGQRREAPKRAEASPRAETMGRGGAAAPSREPTENDIERQARELEEMFQVATTRGASRGTPQAQPQQPQVQRPGAEAPSRQGGWGQESPANRRFDAPQDDAAARQNEQATILVRAMVNAAKCDGQISQAEQQSILGQLDKPSQATIQFLREEFAKPLDVREFAWSVPVGMEQQVYTMSLIAIDVDSTHEEGYLKELAHGLRLGPEVCDQIKGRLMGAGPRLAGVR